MTPDIRWYDSIPSTMDEAAALAAAGAAHGVVVAARHQTAGRGRRGATWQSPPDAGLYFSLIARPSEIAPVALMSLAAGVAVRDGIAATTGLQAELKWPNDVLVGRRKLAGILAEGHAIGTPGQAVVIGVGANLRPAAYSADVTARATSIEGELGRSIDRDAVFAAIVDGLLRCLALLEHDAGDILQAWRAASPTAVGTRVERDGRRGVTAGIDHSGALLITTATGVERIIAGELTWDL